MSIPSVSGTEGKAGEFLESHLGSLGYRVERQNVTQDRFNVIAFAGGDPQVMLCTHIDTVPPVLAIREDDDYLYGRGACDTKGIIAAMLEAGERLRRNRVTNFGYLFVVAEETDSPRQGLHRDRCQIPGNQARRCHGSPAGDESHNRREKMGDSVDRISKFGRHAGDRRRACVHRQIDG